MAPYSKKIQDWNEEQRQNALNRGEEAANVVQQQGEAYVNNLEAAQAAQAAADNAANENYNNVMAKYNNDFAAMVQGESDRIRAEQQQAQQQLKANQNAAKYTGLTELAASVANLIGVGAGNAVSQQYKQYSQDWMRKADQDMREHRMRLDNIRARQNALKQQQLQIQMGQAGQALENARRQADRDFQNNITLAGARRDAALAPVQARQQAQKEADELYTRGLQTAASQANQEQSAAQGWARIEDARKNDELNRLAAGFIPDGKGGYTYDPEGAAKKLGVKNLSQLKGGNSGDDDKPVGYNYPVTINGQQMTLQFKNKESRDNALKTGMGDLRQDMANEAKQMLLKVKYPVNGEFDWDKLVQLTGQKKLEFNGQKIDNPLYGWEPETIQALKGSGDNEADYDTIENFYNRNSQRLSNFNNYMLRASDAQKIYGWADPQTPAFRRNGDGVLVPTSGGSILDEFMGSSAPETRQTPYDAWMRTAQNKRPNNVEKQRS